MFLFAHSGLGLQLAKPFSKGLPRGALLWGTLIPDLIDKPLYYIARAIYGGEQTAQMWISGTRTLGHTAILTLGIAVAAVARKQPLLAALALGMATHLLLDNIFYPTPQSLLWPALGTGFPVFPHASAGEHLKQYVSPVSITLEVLGAVFLGRELLKVRSTRKSGF